VEKQVVVYDTEKEVFVAAYTVVCHFCVERLMNLLEGLRV
jgi:hypothetical protein